MKKIILSLVVVLIILTLTACGHEHIWADATCTTPKTCTECGATEGEVLEHSWTEATCQAPKTCSVCGTTEGNVLEHSWNDATCANPKTCADCGKTEGETLEHSWVEATCQAPKTCSVCGATDGEALAHKLTEATYYNAPVCTVCGETVGTTKQELIDSGIMKNQVSQQQVKSNREILLSYIPEGSDIVGIYDEHAVIDNHDGTSTDYYLDGTTRIFKYGKLSGKPAKGYEHYWN